MHFTTATVFCTVIALLSTVLSVVAGPLLKRDVYEPPITFPSAGDRFRAGETIKVVWDTSSLPPGLKNKGVLMIGYLTSDSENLDVDHPLAEGFLLTDGYRNITLPSGLETRDNYILALLGDSGNISDEFTITSTSYS